MIRRYVFLYFLVLSIPCFLGIVTWQSVRYTQLDRNVRHLEAVQEGWIETNRRLIAGIAVLTSSERIVHVATQDMGLGPIQPERVIQIRIEGE
ncbi:MAG: cell division protein FtsL [Treponema sp.]|nr:cell division protein FtsL [Treponema sp.]